MNSRQKELMRLSLREEKRILRELTEAYRKASDTIAERIAKLLDEYEATGLQSKVYQKKYQEALKRCIDDTLDSLRQGEYESIQDYLENCYTNGFLGCLYDMQGQGVPLIFPIDPEQMAAAITLNSRLSVPLYRKLGIDMNALKKAVRQEVTRGIASGWSYAGIATALNNRMHTGRYNAYRIARTEGGRVSSEATYNAQVKARRNGADVVKEWSSAMDNRTRPDHRALNGQIREIEDYFEVNGYRALYPHGFGVPHEDINCRCASLERARWAVEDEEKIVDPDVTVQTVDTASFSDFRSRYMSTYNPYSRFGGGKKISNAEYKVLRDIAREHGISLSQFKQYSGSVEDMADIIRGLGEAKDHFPLIQDITLALGDMNLEDFATTRGRTITLNGVMFNDMASLSKEYSKLVSDGWFVKGTTYKDIVYHELGHMVEDVYKVETWDVVMQITGIDNLKELTAYVSKNLSKYASYSSHETFAESMSSYLSESETAGLAFDILKACGII